MPSSISLPFEQNQSRAMVGSATVALGHFEIDAGPTYVNAQAGVPPQYQMVPQFHQGVSQPQAQFDSSMALSTPQRHVSQESLGGSAFSVTHTGCLNGGSTSRQQQPNDCTRTCQSRLFPSTNNHEQGYTELKVQSIDTAFTHYEQTPLNYQHDSNYARAEQMMYPVLSPGHNNRELPIISLGRALVRSLGDQEKIRAPVITMLSDHKLSIYVAIEQHFRPDLMSSPERFWKLLKTSFEPPLEVWRPRVNGSQLKALASVRLPSTSEEWNNVLRVLQTVERYLKPSSNPEAAFQALREVACQVEDAWMGRKRIEAPSLKRSVSLMEGELQRSMCKRMMTDSFSSPDESDEQLVSPNSDVCRPPSTTTSQAGSDSAKKLPGTPLHLDFSGHQTHGPAGLVRESAHSMLSTPGAGLHTPLPSEPSFRHQAWRSPPGQPHLEGDMTPFRAAGARNLHPQPQPQQLHLSKCISGVGHTNDTAPEREFVPPSLESATKNGSHLPHVHPEANPCKRVVVLNVGGCRYWTTVDTLCCVPMNTGLFLGLPEKFSDPGSMFWEYFGCSSISTTSSLPSNATGAEVFVDREGTHFSYIMKYLRLVKESKDACAAGVQPESPFNNWDALHLPADPKILESLSKDAVFFRLNELHAHLQYEIMQSASVTYETFYFEAPHSPSAGPKVEMPQHCLEIIADRRKEGYTVEQLTAGMRNEEVNGDRLMTATWVLVLRHSGRVSFSGKQQ